MELFQPERDSECAGHALGRSGREPWAAGIGPDIVGERTNDLTNDQSRGAGETMTFRRINYGQWVLKLVAWDGVLPVVVLLAPFVVKLVFPNHRDVMEVTAVILPIAAFFIRFFVAQHCISSNQCTPLVRLFQIVSLCMAILVLLLIESLMILAHEMPKGAMVATTADWIVWVVLFSVYLACMSFAMYPGHAHEGWSVECRECDAPADFGL
jgi:hypothetical protein